MNKTMPSTSPCITAAVRAAGRKLTLLYDEIMAPSGLRITQYTVLTELARRKDSPPTMRELAQILTMERSALGQTLRPLERDGLVELGFDALDRRRKPVRLTPVGRQAMLRAKPYWADAHKRFTRLFGAAAMEALRTTLRDLVEQPNLDDAFERQL